MSPTPLNTACAIALVETTFFYRKRIYLYLNNIYLLKQTNAKENLWLTPKGDDNKRRSQKNIEFLNDMIKDESDCQVEMNDFRKHNACRFH